MYKDLFLKLIDMILSKKESLKEINEFLIKNVDCEVIYDLDDELISDVYFSLKHYAIGEEEIEKKEWEYLKDCLEGTINYDPIEKMCVITKSSIKKA